MTAKVSNYRLHIRNKSRPTEDSFRDNYDRIFGKKAIDYKEEKSEKKEQESENANS